MNEDSLVLMPTRAMDRKFPAPERDIDYVLDRREALSALLKAMPVRYREAVRLFYFDDVPMEDIAARLGVSTERVRGILTDAEGMMRSAAKVCFPRLCANGDGR